MIYILLHNISVAFSEKGYKNILPQGINVLVNTLNVCCYFT